MTLINDIDSYIVCAILTNTSLHVNTALTLFMLVLQLITITSHYQPRRLQDIDSFLSTDYSSGSPSRYKYNTSGPAW